MFESYLKDGFRMICQIVIDFSTRTGAYMETIRVWDIVAHDKVSDTLEYVLINSVCLCVCFYCVVDVYTLIKKALKGSYNMYTVRLQMLIIIYY